MNPITPEEANKFNEIVAKMPIEQKDEILAKIIGKGPTIADPIIRSIINSN